MQTHDTPPEPVQAVTPQQASSVTELDSDTKRKLEAKVDDFLTALAKTPGHDPGFRSKIQAVHGLGHEDIRRAAGMTGRLLNQQLRSRSQIEADITAQTLDQLRKKFDDLDPNRRGDLLKPRKLFGLFHLGDGLRHYFAAYERAQVPIKSLIQSLYKHQDQLRMANATIDQEKSEAWDIMTALEKHVHSVKTLDSRLSTDRERIAGQDVEKARVIDDELLFHIRQKHRDLLTQLAVCYQSYLAMDIIRKNNFELVKGIDRINTITVSAINTAIMVADALTGQKLVMEQLRQIKGVAGDSLRSAAAGLKEHAAHTEDGSFAERELGTLKTAFRDVFDAMNTIHQNHRDADENLQKTVHILSDEFDRANQKLQQHTGPTYE